MPFIQSGDINISSDVTITQDVAEPIVVHPGGVLVLMAASEGGVIVRGGGYARIAGTTHGLFVAAGGHAVLTGTCLGSVTNDGGNLFIAGVVTGTLVEHAGTTEVAPGAAILDENGAPAEKTLSTWSKRAACQSPNLQARRGQLATGLSASGSERTGSPLDGPSPTE